MLYHFSRVDLTKGKIKAYTLLILAKTATKIRMELTPWQLPVEVLSNPSICKPSVIKGCSPKRKQLGR